MREAILPSVEPYEPPPDYHYGKPLLGARVRREVRDAFRAGCQEEGVYQGAEVEKLLMCWLADHGFPVPGVDSPQAAPKPQAACG